MEIDYFIMFMIGIWGPPIMGAFLYWTGRKARAKLRRNRFERARDLSRSKRR